MEPEEFSERILSGVRRRLRERGHGSIAQAQRHMGLGSTYFKDIGRGKARFDIDQLGMVLQFLEVEPEDFFHDELRDPLDRIVADYSEDDLPEAVKLLGSALDEG